MFRYVCAMTVSGALISAAYAGYVSITPGPDLTFPSNVFEHANVASDYIIKDIYTDSTGALLPLTAHVLLSPQYALVPVIGDTGSSLPNCGPGYAFALGPNEPSCIIRVIYNSSNTLGATDPLQAPYVCKLASYSLQTSACAYPAGGQPFNVVAQSATNTATIALTGGTSGSQTAFFAPGETRVFTVTNTSTNGMTADHIHMGFQPGLQNYVASDSILGCDSVAPGASCTMKVSMKNNLPLFKANVPFTIEGRNTNQIQQHSLVMPSLLQMSNVVFAAPGMAKLTITNRGDKVVALPSLTTLQAEVAALNLTGLTVSDDSASAASCLNSANAALASQGTCSYTFNVAAKSYGSGQLQFVYTPSGHAPITRSVPVVMQMPQIKVTAPVMDQYHNILASDQNADIQITNKGKFAWVRPKVSEMHVFSQTNAANHCNGLTGGKSCNILLPVVKQSGQTASYNILKVTAANTQPMYKTVFPANAVSAGPSSSENQHMGYMAVDIANNTNGAVRLSEVQPVVSTTLPNVVSCSKANSHCFYQYQDTCKDNAVLASHQSCQMWFKMRNVKHLVKPQTGTVELKAQALSLSGKHLLTAVHTSPITVQDSEHLFAGGTITDVNNDSNANYLVYFNGTNWQPYTTTNPVSLTKPVLTLKYWGGDLYIGGQMVTSVGNYLVRDKGNVLDGLDNSIVGEQGSQINGVYALYDDEGDLFDSSDSLMVGGHFNSVNNSVGNQDIARWDGSSWDSNTLGFASLTGASTNPGSIYTITTDYNNSGILVGGDFVFVQSTPTGVFTNYIAKRSATGWNHLNNANYEDVDGPVWKLIRKPYTNAQYIFAAGTFQNIPSANIGVQNGFAAYYENAQTPQWLGYSGLQNEGGLDGDHEVPKLMNGTGQAFTLSEMSTSSTATGNGSLYIGGNFGGGYVEALNDGYMPMYTNVSDVAKIMVHYTGNQSNHMQVYRMSCDGPEYFNKCSEIPDLDDGGVYALQSDSNGNIYVAGDFDLSGSNFLLYWNASTSNFWYSYGSSEFHKGDNYPGAAIYALEWAPSLSIQY